MSNNSAQKKSNEKNLHQNIITLGNGISELQSIGSAKTGGERLQKIAGLIAKAYGATK